MNPLTNRWAAVFAVAGVLLLVSELVGTDEDGGVLSQAAGVYAAAPAGGEPAPPAGVVQVVPAEVVDAEETPEEDLPQVIQEDSPDAIDAEDAPTDEGSEPTESDPDVFSDEFVEEDSGE